MKKIIEIDLTPAVERLIRNASNAKKIHVVQTALSMRAGAPAPCKYDNYYDK